MPKYALFLLVASISFFNGCGKEQKKVEEIIRPVRYSKVIMPQGEQQRSFSGVTKAGTEAKLSFKVSGTLVSLKVKEGDKVKKGTLIGTIDDKDSRLQFEKSKTSVRQTKVQMDTAKANLNRVKKLFENNSIALNEYEQAKEKFETAKAGYESAKRGVDILSRELSYYKLYSPMPGFVANKEVEENENVSSGQTIVRIQGEKGIEINVGLPEQYISSIKSGEMATIKISAIKDKVFKGTISEVSFSLDEDSSTYPVAIRLNETDARIRIGMTANVSFQFAQQEKIQHLLVPIHAVSEDQNGHFVLAVTPTEVGFGVVSKKRVKIGKLKEKGFEIIEGLQENEFVVTAGIEKISDGKKVRFLK